MTCTIVRHHHVTWPLSLSLSLSLSLLKETYCAFCFFRNSINFGLEQKAAVIFVASLNHTRLTRCRPLKLIWRCWKKRCFHTIFSLLIQSQSLLVSAATKHRSDTSACFIRCIWYCVDVTWLLSLLYDLAQVKPGREWSVATDCWYWQHWLTCLLMPIPTFSPVSGAFPILVSESEQL